MKTLSTLILIVFMSLALIAPSSAAVINGEMAPDFTLTDSTGATHSLSDFKGKYVVLEWVNYDCPFVQKHYSSGNMQTLQQQAGDKEAVWLSINSSAAGKQGHFSSGEINNRISQYKAQPTAYLVDADGKVGKMYGAKTTPHMYIIDPDGNLVYQGAIDDNPSWDPSVIPNSLNYVLLALNEAISGKSVSNPTTKAYGCSVKY